MGIDAAAWHFDGESFWLVLDHRKALCSATVTPQHGWWHADGCACDLCRAAGLT
jgi:hypothetical protein